MKRGRPKGYSPYIEIKYEDLADWVGRKTVVPVSKKWLQTLMGTDLDSSEDLDLDNSSDQNYDESLESKIEYTLTHFNDE